MNAKQPATPSSSSRSARGAFDVLNRATALGVASWAIPFAASFLFFNRAGELTIAQPLFKSIMVLVGGGSGAALLVAAFRMVRPSLRTGLALGAYWLALNLAFDLGVLVGFMRMDAGGYLADIGLRYLLLPVMGAAMGLIGAQERARSD